MDTLLTQHNSGFLQRLKEKYEGKLVQDAHSPAGNWLQFTLEKIEKGLVEISLTVHPDMCNPYGNIHGGMMAVVMDEAIGWAVISMEMPQHYTSLNLNVDFLYAIPKGEKLFARAEIIRAGKKIIHAGCTVRDTQDRILGRASSNLVVTGMPLQIPDYPSPSA
jgi:acyl-coenzyme A thioesterase 13